MHSRHVMILSVEFRSKETASEWDEREYRRPLEYARKYFMVHICRTLAGIKLGIHRHPVVHQHRGHPCGSSVLQNGSPGLFPFRQRSGVRRRCPLGLCQCILAYFRRCRSCLGGLSQRCCPLLYHHRDTLRHSMFQAGQAGARSLWCRDTRKVN